MKVTGRSVSEVKYPLSGHGLYECSDASPVGVSFVGMLSPL